MEMKDDYGNPIFESIRITLVCGTQHVSYSSQRHVSYACDMRAQTIASRRTRCVRNAL